MTHTYIKIRVKDPGSDDYCTVEVCLKPKAVTYIEHHGEQVGTYPFPVDEIALFREAAKLLTYV